MPLASAAPALGDRRILAAGAVGIGLLMAIAILASIGGPQGPIDGLSWILILLARAGPAPAAYILGAAGLGRLARPLFPRSRDPWALQLAVGLALLLSLSHALGVMRLFAGASGHIVAIGIVGVGIALLAHQILASGAARNASGILPASALPGLFGGAILFVAACNPPGWLWASEFGGFDALSYHLQLPQEWLARGWVWPLNHNVYSFLPGYVESAYCHLGAILGAPNQPTPASPMIGLLHGDGAGVLSCQLLHAGLTVCAALLIARATRLAADRFGLPAPLPSAAAGFAASLYLLTPWTIVVGSLAYNEAAMTALGAGALLAALDDRISPVRRGALTGMLIGIACSAKPSALTLVGAPVGLALLALSPRRSWAPLVLAGALAGIAALSPWLARNWYACGNPVFPLLTSWFGTAHWTPEQVSRSIAGHSFGGSLIERLGLMFVPGSTPAGPAHRGLFHPQWFAFFPVAALCAVILSLRPPLRSIGLVLALGLTVQLALWLFTTHIQSRFLVPLGITGSVLFGLAAVAPFRGPIAAGPAAGAARPAWMRPRLPAILASTALLAQGAASAWIFSTERDGRPCGRLADGQAGGVASFSGQSLLPALRSAAPPERRAALDSLPPFMFINLAIAPGVRVYLLGDSTPLYLRPPLVYHSTWDASPLGLAMRAEPGNPAGWSARLRAEGVELVLVNLAELSRLQRSGWYDPIVTPDAVQQWLSAHATLLRAWPDGQALFQLAPPPPERAP